MYKSPTFQHFLSEIQNIFWSDQVQSMRTIRHHPGMNCFEHSLFVSYVSYRLAKCFKLDHYAAARGGLLHDLYLYDSRDKSNYEGHQCFAHPKAALVNAKELCGDLTEKEENIILSHMWPLTSHKPKSKEAVLVSFADKVCATLETIGVYRLLCFLRTGTAAYLPQPASQELPEPMPEPMPEPLPTT